MKTEHYPTTEATLMLSPSSVDGTVQYVFYFGQEMTVCELMKVARKIKETKQILRRRN